MNNFLTSSFYCTFNPLNGSGDFFLLFLILFCHICFGQDKIQIFASMSISSVWRWRQCIETDSSLSRGYEDVFRAMCLFSCLKSASDASIAEELSKLGFEKTCLEEHSFWTHQLKEESRKSINKPAISFAILADVSLSCIALDDLKFLISLMMSSLSTVWRENYWQRKAFLIATMRGNSLCFSIISGVPGGWSAEAPPSKC